MPSGYTYSGQNSNLRHFDQHVQPQNSHQEQHRFKYKHNNVDRLPRKHFQHNSQNQNNFRYPTNNFRRDNFNRNYNLNPNHSHTYINNNDNRRNSYRRPSNYHYPTHNDRPSNNAYKIQQYRPVNTVTSYTNSNPIYRSYLRMLDQRILRDRSSNSDDFKFSQNKKICYLDTFCVDHIGMDSIDVLSKPPIVSGTRPINLLSIPLKYDRDGIHPDMNICFNCGGKHVVQKCTHKPNQGCINFNRLLRNDFGGNNKRLMFRERYFGDIEEGVADKSLDTGLTNGEDITGEQVFIEAESESKSEIIDVDICEGDDKKDDTETCSKIDDNMKISENDSESQFLPCKRRKSPKNQTQSINRVEEECSMSNKPISALTKFELKYGQDEDMLKIYTHVDEMPKLNNYHSPKVSNNDRKHIADRRYQRVAQPFERDARFQMLPPPGFGGKRERQPFYPRGNIRRDFPSEQSQFNNSYRKSRSGSFNDSNRGRQYDMHRRQSQSRTNQKQFYNYRRR